MNPSNNARATLMHMLTGYWTTQILYVAAKLGIADLLEHGPKTSDQLAISTGSHAPSLYRLLRALANINVFEEDDGRRVLLMKDCEQAENEARAFGELGSGEGFV